MQCAMVYYVDGIRATLVSLLRVRFFIQKLLGIGANSRKRQLEPSIFAGQDWGLARRIRVRT